MRKFKSLPGTLAITIVVVLMASVFPDAESCSCEPKHPQRALCDADYAIIARVLSKRPPNQSRAKKIPLLDNVQLQPEAQPQPLGRTFNAYKIKIKRAFKMSKKAHFVLKSRTLFSHSDDFASVCGVQLHVNETYLITGRVPARAHKAWISLCDYIRPLSSLTNQQRKGLRLLYKQECVKCKVRTCFNCEGDSGGFGGCEWQNMDECQEKYGICMRQNGTCLWRNSLKLRACLNTRKHLMDDEP